MRSERSSEPILEEAAPPSPPRYPHPPSAPPPSAQVRLKRISATIDDTPAYVDLFEPSVATKASAEQLTPHTADGNYLELCDLESMLEKADIDASSACAYSLALSYTTAQTWQNKEAVALHQEAYNKLEELKSWNGSRNAWIKLPFTNDQTHPLFRKGVTSSNVTSLRLLLKVDLLWHMLCHGKLESGGVVFDISRAEKINKEAYFIQGGTYKPIQFADITRGPIGSFKTLELSAKFETEIDRYTMMNIPKAGPDEENKFLKLWAEVVVAEKRRQLLHNLTGQTNLPWRMKNVWTMPVVIWLKKG